MRLHFIVACAALGLAVSACAKKDTPEPAASAPAAVQTAPLAASTPPSAPEAAPDASTLPVEEQYESEAESEITPDNLSSKLDELEKEISAP